MTILTSSKCISIVFIIVLRVSSSPKSVVIRSFTFFFFFKLCFLLVLSCSYAKERLLKVHCQSCKCFATTLTFSFFITKCDICLVDVLASIWTGVRWLTSVIFVVGAGDSIVDILPVWRCFLLDIVGTNRVDILIDYRAASAD